MTPYPIRAIEPGEWPAYYATVREAFNGSEPPEAAGHLLPVVPFDRTLVAFDGEVAAGCAMSHGFRMTVPGDVLAVAGVTGVGVLPSHRRRGVLSSLMRRQLADLRANGESVAALYASEGAIYGRYGYGMAADGLRVSLPGGARFAPHAPSDPALRIRLVEPGAAEAEIAAVFDAVRLARPGMYAWPPELLRYLVADHEYRRHGAGPLRAALAVDESGTRGYALFRVRSGWDDDDRADGVLSVLDLHGLDPAAEAFLWRFALDRDLVTTVKATVPVDSPLRSLLADPRDLRARFGDDLWIRLVDLAPALASRAYSAPLDVVMEVADEVCPWNAGRWRLTVKEGRAACEPSDAPADVELPVAALGAAYLGGRGLVPFGAAGLAREPRPGTLRAMSAAFAWDPKPWAAHGF
ncbi:GNAT family N-acetyltransferase [Bailinhaonella thermotolerans]|uniref:GNAT family N-acetyltransferase n=1 Tax=Bailinhaonella thermotolerans TaxID=1070861 RepID=A0A3A4A914_9ACTN|nr:GNAT family N-acetyltransferase [Bailinhaonella thermotolerans]RJL22754.1 GNAT family N-acetyltransferase [Bailinhaonella thermotolerans]